jgi:hypothetical protein
LIRLEISSMPQSIACRPVASHSVYSCSHLQPRLENARILPPACMRWLNITDSHVCDTCFPYRLVSERRENIDYSATSVTVFLATVITGVCRSALLITNITSRYGFRICAFHSFRNHTRAVCAFHF